MQLPTTIYGDDPQDPWSGGVYKEGLRGEGRDWPGRAHSMIGVKRLQNLRELTEQALAEGIPGDLIETGVWRGGACILMRGLLAAHGETTRRVVVADSFDGLPPPRPELFPADEGDTHHTFRQLAISQNQVREHFAAYGLLDDKVEFLEGLVPRHTTKSARSGVGCDSPGWGYGTNRPWMAWRIFTMACLQVGSS